jgi:hypothetical protein
MRAIRALFNREQIRAYVPVNYRTTSATQQPHPTSAHGTPRTHTPSSRLASQSSPYAFLRFFSAIVAPFSPTPAAPSDATPTEHRATYASPHPSTSPRLPSPTQPPGGSPNNPTPPNFNRHRQTPHTPPLNHVIWTRIPISRTHESTFAGRKPTST